MMNDAKPRRTARELARAVEGGRDVGAALRHLDGHGSEPGAVGVAEALARFLVARCDSHHRRLASRASGCRRFGG